jgi:hypothetical protein
MLNNIYDEFEDTKGEMRIRKSIKDRSVNCVLVTTSSIHPTVLDYPRVQYSVYYICHRQILEIKREIQIQ